MHSPAATRAALASSESRELFSCNDAEPLHFPIEPDAVNNQSERARESRFKLLIGCMVGTSLGMAPARLLASAAAWVDLDGPLLLARDREHALAYTNGRLGLPSSQLWG